MLINEHICYLLQMKLTFYLLLGNRLIFYEWKVQLLIFTQQIQIPELENAKESIGASSHVTQVIKNQPASAGDTGDMRSVPGSGRSPAGGHSNPL